MYITRILTPQLDILQSGNPFQQFRAIELQSNIELLYIIACTVVMFHITFIIYALFQALWGQYFYVPFFTENVELHLGEVTRTAYSGGNRSWSYSKNNQNRYKDNSLIQNIIINLKKFVKLIINKIIQNN